MEKKDRRKYPRIQIFDPISYLSEDAKGGILEQNVAVVRNVSQTGVQIESFWEIKSKYLSLMLFDLNKKQIEVKGNVIYCKKTESGSFNCGINLEGTVKQNLRFVKALVKSYHYKKEDSRMVISSGIPN
jgi:hypothetical protein